MKKKPGRPKVNQDGFAKKKAGRPRKVELVASTSNDAPDQTTTIPPAPKRGKGVPKSKKENLSFTGKLKLEINPVTKTGKKSSTIQISKKINVRKGKPAKDKSEDIPSLVVKDQE